MESVREFKNRLKSIIRLNFRDKHFNVKALSKISQMSPSHLREQVRLHYGFPPHVLIENVRIENSFPYLMRDMEISDVAVNVGFANAQSFRRTFKRRLNILPREFRQILDKAEEDKETSESHQGTVDQARREGGLAVSSRKVRVHAGPGWNRPC